MKQAAIIVFPGTNRETDMAQALKLSGFEVHYIFYTQKKIPKNIDLIALAGGFSYGDYLRSGAIAANMPIIDALKKYADLGGLVIGICNGFQILCEVGLLPGTLMHNQSGRFICTTTDIKIVNAQTPFTSHYQEAQIINLPIAHGEGNYFADDITLARLDKNQQIVLEYCDNPNGSQRHIAGIMNEQKTILGMMPHPENHIDNYQKNTHGSGIFYSLLAHITK